MCTFYYFDSRLATAGGRQVTAGLTRGVLSRIFFFFTGASSLAAITGVDHIIICVIITVLQTLNRPLSERHGTSQCCALLSLVNKHTAWLTCTID